MNYNFSEWIMCRVPSWPMDLAEQDLEEILSDLFFRNAIKLASRDFYELLSKKAFNAGLLNLKEISVLKNYLKRMCFRSTPFGLFAGYGMIKWGHKSAVRLSSGKLNLIPDLAISYQYIRNSTELKTLRVFSNPTAFRKSQVWRYYKPIVNEGGTLFEQCSCPDLPPLNRVINFCRKPVKYDRLLTILSAYSSDQYEAEEYIRCLVEWGILLTELEPNVTGEIYQHRMDCLFGKDSADTSVQYHKCELEYDSNWYSIYSLNLSGNIENTAQAKIMKALDLCLKLNTNTDPAGLSTFRRNFINRFDRETIPLMEAIDPVVGIGYDSMGSEPEQDLADDLILAATSDRHISTNEAYTIIANRLLNQQAGSCLPMKLHAEDLQSIPAFSGMTAPGAGVLFRIVDGQIVIDQAGGQTSTSLAGRFTLFDAKLLKALRAIARMEEQANPGVLFAEIAWYNDEHAANINMRKHIRKYEIPIMTTPTHGVNKIDLRDLYVFAENDKIILFSKKYNKRVIPVLSTAYNFKRSDLPVFRFLCDLQYQGLAVQFIPDLQDIVPGLSFYPRLVIEGIILSLAKWIISEEDVSAINSGKTTFNDCVNKYHLPTCFSIRKYDQEIVFDRSKPGCETDFLFVVKTMKQVLIKEFLVPRHPVCLSQKGGGHYVQFLAFLTNKLSTYQPVEINSINSVKRRFIPLEKWMYFKLYCHPFAAQEILSKYIYSALLMQKDKIDQWFFIRYNDPEHHLRVRILSTEKGIQNMLLKMFAKLVEKGYCSSIQIDTYQREIERYVGECIEEAERVFSESSKSYCAFILEENPDKTDLGNYVLHTVERIINASSMNVQNRIALCQSMRSSYQKEFGNHKEMKVELDRKARAHKTWYLNNKEHWASASFQNALYSYFAKVRSVANHRLTDVTASIIHMHVNRCFTSKQRINEMVVYAILEKYYMYLLKTSSTV